MQGYRSFGGKRYYFNRSVLTKTEARGVATNLRKLGMLVRITKSKEWYELWVRH